MDDLRALAVIQELEQQRNLLGTRCAEMAAALAIQIGVNKEQEAELVKLRPKEDLKSVA